MAHALACAFEQAGGIREHGAVVEADICMRLERIDIPKRGVSHTSDRASVVQELADVGAAAAHALKPGPCHHPVRIDEAGKPILDPGIPPHRAVEPQQIVHPNRMPACPVLRNPQKPAAAYVRCRPLRHFAAYGSANRYSPVSSSKMSGSSARSPTQTDCSFKVTRLAMTPTVKAMDSQRWIWRTDMFQ